MVKKLFTVFFGIAFVFAIGGVVYADASGLFSQNDEAAVQLVDKYFSFVMKRYVSPEEKISFRGIVKEGCDFWYFNDSANKRIAENHRKGSDFEVEDADCSIEYNSVEYNNNVYTVEATVTGQVKYKNYPEIFQCISKHIFTIEQRGNTMYIVNDVTKDRGDILVPPEIKSGTNTPDIPECVLNSKENIVISRKTE